MLHNDTSIIPFKKWNEENGDIPYLKPAYTDVVELGYTFKNQYYLGLTYTHIKDQINKVSETDSAKAIIDYMPENIGKTAIYGLSLTAPFQATKWWQSNNSLIVQYKKVTAPEFDIQKGTFTVRSDNEFILRKSTTLNLGLFYCRRSLYGNTVTHPFSNVSLGVSQKLLSDRLTLSANVWDLFYKNNARMISYYNNSPIYIDEKFQTRQLTLSAVYNFNLGKVFKAKEIENSNEEEKGRLH